MAARAPTVSISREQRLAQHRPIGMSQHPSWLAANLGTHVIIWNVMHSVVQTFISHLRQQWWKNATLFFLLAVTFVANPANAQRDRGELQVEVHDPQGRATAAAGQLVSESNQVRKEFAIGADGNFAVSELPFGVYRLSVTAEGFAIWSGLVEVRNGLPVRVVVVLEMAAVSAKIEVTDAATLLD